ncbi:MAG: hypothetical protein SFX74_12760 [Fimbriimonadaceae bacterium]|nr:hypothetical protein [Fimbriimonadaceae bacterium]
MTSESGRQIANACLALLALGALGWWVARSPNGVIERRDRTPMTEFGESIAAIDRDGKPGDVDTVRADWRRIGSALQAFRAKHGRMPAGSPMLPNGEFRQASKLSVADLTAPTQAVSFDPDGSEAGLRFEHYSLEFGGPRLDGTDPSEPPAIGRDVWVRCSYRRDGQPRVMLLRSDGAIEDYARENLAMILTVSNALTGNTLRYVRVPYDQAGVPGDAILIVWPEMHLATFPRLPSMVWRGR